MKTTMKRISAAAAKAAVALAVAFCAATTAEAARNWNGSASGNFSNNSNWSSTSGRRYFRNGNLSGEKITRIYLSGNVTEKDNSGLCFDTPPTSSPTYWRTISIRVIHNSQCFWYGKSDGKYVNASASGTDCHKCGGR